MKKGIIFAFIAAVISGVSIFYNKQVVIKGIDPLVFNIYKNGGAAILLSLPLFLFPSKTKLTVLKSSLIVRLVLIGLIGGSIPFLLFFTGLQTVSAANANLIQKTLFLWVAALAIPILGESLNLWQAAGYLMVAFSNLFIGGLTGFAGNTGEILIFAATLLWSMENIIAKFTLKEADDKIVAFARMGIGTIFLIIFILFQNKISLLFSLNPSQILPIIGSVFLLTAYVSFWMKALKHAPATIVTSILILATPITNILTAIFISHTIPQVQVPNMILSVLGVGLIIYFLIKPHRKNTAFSF